jgi:transposase
LNHLGLSQGPKRSTLAYANKHRSCKIFEEAFYQLLDSTRQYDWGKRKFRFKNPLYSIDATTIDLCLSLFDWARFRRAKGAIKLHLILDHNGYLPTFANITEGKTHEVRVLKGVISAEFRFPAGSIVTFDKGYIDLELFNRWTEEGIIFVTRMKDNATYDVVRRMKCPKNSTIRRDEIVEFNGQLSQEKCPQELRRIEVWDDVNQRLLVLLTNHLTFGSTTIAAIYKDRWAIENFFKTIKQNLRIKTFVGTSANAVHIQIWTALIAILMLKILKLKSTFRWSMSNLVALLRFNLFTYRELWEWINKPYDTPEQMADATQMNLFEQYLGQQDRGVIPAL